MVGLKKSTATAQLEEAGFEVDATTTDTNDDSEDGTVLTQDPTEGSADVGSTVTLEIGKFVDDGTTP